MDKRVFVDLGFTREPVPLGTHTCLFYRDEAMKNRMVLRYMAAGIRNGEKVVCLMDSLSKAEIQNWFRSEAVDTGGYDPERGLFVANTNEVYYPEGCFVPEKMIGWWRHFTEEAIAAGYNRLRVTGETSWLPTIPGSERYLEYEMLLNQLIQDYPVTVLCQFDTNQIPGTILIDLLDTHPMLIANGQIMHNPFYRAPKEERFHRFRFLGRKIEKTKRVQRVSAILLAAAGILESLPTLYRKAEFTEGFLQRVFQIKDYCLYLQEYTAVKNCALAETYINGQSGVVCCEIRTADFFFGYLLLVEKWAKLNPRFQALILNYLNLLALSLENAKQNEQLQTINNQLKAEIKEKEKIEALLRQNKQWVNATMEGTDEGLWEWDMATGVIMYDENWQRILGYEPGEITFTSEWFLQSIHPDDKPLLDKTRRGYHSGNKKYFELEYRLKNKAGEWIRVWTRGICLPDNKEPDGTPRKLSGTNRDITLYRQTQEALQASVQELATEKERAELLKVQKLESLGLLASGIAHDFNNLLAAILSNVQLAALKWKKGVNGDKDLQAVEKATLKAAKLTKQLMAFAKGGAPVKQPAKLCEIIKDTAEFALRGSAVKCRYLIAKDLWPVEIDGGQISQVIHNIMLNAAHAMPQGGIIEVSACNVVVSVQNRMRLRAGNYVRVEIEDHGVGIPEEILTKIFDPYFTTKKEGNGLGLSFSYYIIQNHDGYLGVQSRVGVGSTFFFYLPATGAQPVADKGEKKTISHGKGKVLLMDDEPLIRSSLREFLERCGYEAVEAKDGTETVALYIQEKNNAAPFDVVIVDLTVPGGMGGKEAVHHLLAADPEAKVIASSGYCDDPVMSDYRKFGFCDVVFKPFKLEELCTKIKKLVDPA